MAKATNPPDGLFRQRCFNHVGREAAARCTRCNRYFCRECVTEHYAQLICATCLAETSGGYRRSSILRQILHAAAGMIGLVVAWYVFYLLGSWLLTAPHSFHEGTIWLQQAS
ncbi:MAG: rhomboid family protein [Planctomycetota bacterium]|jgi:hypothetical protein